MFAEDAEALADILRVDCNQKVRWKKEDIDE